MLGCALLAAFVSRVHAGVPGEFVRHHVGRLSLMHGWVPLVVQVLGLAVLVCAVGWRSRRWRLRLLPLALVAGTALAATTHWYIESAGVSGEPAPPALWGWVGLTGTGIAVAVLGWRSARWWRRGVSVLAVTLCLLSGALTVNEWAGYFPTVYAAWSQLTSGPLPDQADWATVTVMRRNGAVPTKGVLVPVNISADASKFKHRGELVYLPPAWFTSTPPSRLPAVMMIGGEFNTPTDWVRVGQAVKTADDFAAAHGGNAPVLVFVDSGGAFNIDTECVNGSRGNAADHLMKDVVPFVISRFSVSSDRTNWGVAGFSTGGTCAIDLTVMHPDRFSAFVDIAGDLSPNTGTKQQTVDRLFGGSREAWAAFDPSTVITRHGRYRAVSGWFASAASGDSASSQAAKTLCGLAGSRGIACTIVTQPGKHDWVFAAAAFATALPWLAGQLHTPGVPLLPLPPPSVSLPGATPPSGVGTPSPVQVASTLAPSPAKRPA